jgi:hypothetical protein
LLGRFEEAAQVYQQIALMNWSSPHQLAQAHNAAGLAYNLAGDKGKAEK